eukprot:6903929-Prymnesium_polylepis.1
MLAYILPLALFVVSGFVDVSTAARRRVVGSPPPTATLYATSPPQPAPPPAAPADAVLATRPAEAAHGSGFLEAEPLWAMLAGECMHLTTRDGTRVRRAVDILLLKTQPAEGARSPADVLAILAALKTAQEMLKLQCDAATVSAVLLGQAALTGQSPTWPLSSPDPFTLEVDALLNEQRRLKALRAM